MKIKQLTDEQQLENLELALRLWNERVKPRQVVPGLRRYRCGTQACFGGWLATWPEFKEKGVLQFVDGSPYMADIVNAPRYLFGISGLFNSKQDGFERGHGYSIIVNRLTRAIKTKREQIATTATAQA